MLSMLWDRETDALRGYDKLLTIQQVCGRANTQIQCFMMVILIIFLHRINKLLSYLVSYF